jgi:hypothetical protein
MNSGCKPIYRSAIAAWLVIVVAHASAAAPFFKPQTADLGQW